MRTDVWQKTVKQSLQKAAEARREARRRGSHILQTTGPQTAVTPSALRDGRTPFPGRFLVLTSVRGRVDPRDTVRMEGLGQFKNLTKPWGIEPETPRPVAQCELASVWSCKNTNNLKFYK